MKYIDSNGVGVPLTAITFTSPDVTLTQSMTMGTYRGKLSSDGQSITGTWSQGKTSLPLILSLATPDTLWRSAGPGPMAADADPSYEVATIKPATPEEVHPIFDLQAAEFRTTGTSAAELIKIVYKIRGRQVIGGPSWLEDSKFDITAKSDTPGIPSEDQTRVMVRKLLTERFHLVCHTGQQLYPALALTLDPKGPRPTPSDPNFNLQGGAMGRQEGGDTVLHFSGITMQAFLKVLMDRFRDKQVVDETGLTGTYDITLRIPANLASTGNGGTEDEVGIAYIAAAEKAGFKIVSKKAPLPVVIIDHIDPPTPN
jgi:uncharacterized protein (TIGR03435 family)